MGVFCAVQTFAYTIYVDAANEGGTEDCLSLATAWGTMSEGVADLALTNAAGSDFRILHDSSCIDAGRAIAGIEDDLYGHVRPRLNAYDIGVHEVGQAGTLFVTQ